MKSDRSRQEFCNERLVMKIGFDAAENDSLKVCEELVKSEDRARIHIGPDLIQWPHHTPELFASRPHHLFVRKSTCLARHDPLSACFLSGLFITKCERTFLKQCVWSGAEVRRSEKYLETDCKLMHLCV